MAERRTSLLLALAIFAAALGSFVAGAAERALWPPDEPRYAEISREMLSTGEWLVPHIEGRLYPEKPPLVFWLGAGGLAATGGSDVGPRLPSMVLGAATVAVLFLLARALAGTAAGLAAAAALATMFEFSFLARRANLDATLTCFTTLSIAAFARGYLLGADGRRLRWYVLAYAACGLAVLVKGPAGLVVPALVAAAVVVSREGPRALLRPHLALGAAIVLGMALAWVLPAVLHAHALAVARGEAPWGYAETLLLRNAAEHAFREDEGKSGAIWYYLERLPGDAAPWSIFFPAAVLAIARWRGARWREADRLAIAWTVPVFVLFSLLRAKRNLYLLPIFPGLGLLVGLVAARVAEEPDRARHPLVAWPLRILFAAGVLGGLVLMGGAAALPRGLAEALARRVPGWYDAIGPALSAGYLARMAALGAGALAAGAAGLSASLRGRARGVLAAAAGAGAVVSLTGALLAFPILDRTYSGERLASRATALAREAGGARIALYGHEHESFPFYMESAGLPRLWTAAELEQFLSAENGSPAIVVGLDHPGILGTPLARGIWRGRQLVILANGAAAERLGAHGR